MGSSPIHTADKCPTEPVGHSYTPKFPTSFLHFKNRIRRLMKPPDSSEFLCYPVADCPMVASICKYLDKVGKLAFNPLYNLRSTLAVMKVCLVNSCCHWKSKCINHNMFLSSFNLFVPVNALTGRVDIVGCFHASGINDSYAGALLPADESVYKRMRRVHNYKAARRALVKALQISETMLSSHIYAKLFKQTLCNYQTDPLFLRY